jgi:hypothetical protein
VGVEKERLARRIYEQSAVCSYDLWGPAKTIAKRITPLDAQRLLLAKAGYTASLVPKWRQVNVSIAAYLLLNPGDI